MRTASILDLQRRMTGAVRSRIARLQALEAELARMIHECGRGQVADCRIVEVLADQTHAHFLTVRPSRDGALKRRSLQRLPIRMWQFPPARAGYAKSTLSFPPL